jgi:hypothetical protein
VLFKLWAAKFPKVRNHWTDYFWVWKPLLEVKDIINEYLGGF